MSPSWQSDLPKLDLSRAALFLDVDGTLLDIAPTPDAVIVPRPLPAALASLAKKTGGALALVSGRTIGNLDALFAPLKLPAAGCHGAQLRIGGVVEELRPSIPETLRQRALQLGALEGLLVEDKGATIALHYRLTPNPQSALRAIARLAAAARAAGLDLMQGKSVVELKPAGIDKGQAIHRFMMREPFLGRRPIFVGDDVTDEDGFAALADYDGVGICVGCRNAHATLDVEAPANIRRWLYALAELL
jgi:trehalose 6-phosphate phosphatase